MKRVMKNKAQMQISFGMIFSILLIIVFVVFAFFGIKKFIEVQNNILAKKFIDDLNNDLEKMWKSSRGSQEVSYNLPGKVESVCLGEKDKEHEAYYYNVYFLPEKNFDNGKLEYVNFEKTLNGKKEICFETENKKINFVIDKDYGETLVSISGEKFVSINKKDEEKVKNEDEEITQENNEKEITEHSNLEVKSGDLFISLSGSDSNSGTINSPLKTLEEARNRIRVMKSSNSIPNGGITVWIRQGIYERYSSFELNSQDSGSLDKPITYASYPGEKAIIIGGRKLNSGDLSLVTSEDYVWSRLRTEAKGNLYKIDLSSYTTNYGEIKALTEFKGSVIGPLELYEPDFVYRLGRWPNYVENSVNTNPDKNVYTITQDSYNSYSFSYSDERQDAWASAEDPWVIGYLGDEYADCNVPIESISASSNYIQTKSGCYGKGESGNPYYGYNLLEEVDLSGEYYLNRNTGILYIYPISGISSNEFIISMLEEPILNLKDTEYIFLESLIIEGGRGDIIHISGSYNKIENCIIKNSGRHGAVISGYNNGIINSEVSYTGFDGVRVSGGSVNTLESSDNYVSNNEIHHTGRWSPAYSPGVNLIKASDGYAVGVRVNNNYIHDIDGVAIYYHGNNNIIEYNEISNVVKNSADMGAIYTGDFWTSRGTIIRYNYIHDIVNNPLMEPNVVGMYFDDTINDQSAYGNIIENVRGWCVLHASGPYINIQNNIFVNCERGAYHIHSVGAYQSWILEDLYNMYPVYTNLYWKEQYPELSLVQRPWRNQDNSWNFGAVSPYDQPDHSLASKNIAWKSSPFLFYWDTMYTNKVLSMEDNLENTVEVTIDKNQRRISFSDPSAVSSIGFQTIPFSEIGIK